MVVLIDYKYLELGKAGSEQPIFNDIIILSPRCKCKI